MADTAGESKAVARDADSDRPLLDTKGLSPVIQAIAALLDATNVRGVLIGAAAVGLVARPRLTRDVDALVLLDVDRWPAFLEQAARLGLIPRIKDALKFARQSRVFLLRHEPTGVGVDISLGALPFEEETIGRAARIDIQGIEIPVASPEDLVVMKAVAGRSKDQPCLATLIRSKMPSKPDPGTRRDTRNSQIVAGYEHARTR